MLRRLFILMLLSLLSVWTATAKGGIQPDMSPDSVKAALQRLDKALEERKTFISHRQAVIDSLKGQIKRQSAPEQRLKTMMVLGDTYASFNNDSCITWYSRGREYARTAALDSLATAFTLKHATFLPLANLVGQANESFDSIAPASLTGDLLTLYHDTGRQMNSYLAAYYNHHKSHNEAYSARSLSHQNALVALLQPDDPRYLLNKGESFLTNKEYDKAYSTIRRLVEQLPITDNMYARATHILADIARIRGNRNEMLYYLACSALSDTRTATLEITSLQELGSKLFEQKDIDRAYRYLSTALDNAVECHAALRIVQISEDMHIIRQAHEAAVEAKDQSQNVIITIMGLILFGLIIVLVVLRVEMVKMRRLRDRLAQANKVKETYISRFLSLCSIYMDKLNQFSKLAVSKISTGKSDEFLKMLRSGKFVDDQSAEFYQVFDEAFLHIYPNFTEKVNELLKPEMRFEIPDSKSLNSELRILAFIRLGVNDGARIARVLNYSINTIYAYRNKLKGRAINRDTFEDDIMKIDA